MRLSRTTGQSCTNLVLQAVPKAQKSASVSEEENIRAISSSLRLVSRKYEGGDDIVEAVSKIIR